MELLQGVQWLRCSHGTGKMHCSRLLQCVVVAHHCSVVTLPCLTKHLKLLIQTSKLKKCFDEVWLDCKRFVVSCDRLLDVVVRCHDLRIAQPAHARRRRHRVQFTTSQRRVRLRSRYYKCVSWPLRSIFRLRVRGR
jgi:hypothetical protein